MLTSSVMGLVTAAPRRLLVLFAFTFAALGGLFLGLSSCGGFAWHREAAAAFFVAWLVAGVVLPGFPGGSWGRRALWGPAPVAVFVLAQSVAAAFYPDDPASLVDLVRRIATGWRDRC